MAKLSGKLPARLFAQKGNENIMLAVLGATDGILIFHKDPDGVVKADVTTAQIIKLKPIIELLFSSYAAASSLLPMPGKIDDFDGVEIKTPMFESFTIDPTLLPANIKLQEAVGTTGFIKQRSFSYDMTNPEIAAIAAENDARLTYYVKPPYFSYIQNNLNNTLIRGMALIGKPGTGKSTDAIAAVRSLGGIILTTQMSGGMLENNLFINTKPNRTLTDLIEKINQGIELTADETKTFDMLSRASSSFIEVDEVIIRALKLNCPVLLDEFAYANMLVKARFNCFTDNNTKFRHEGKVYDIPENFFLFLTWNPGDDGTTDIPKALVTRFPILIVPSINSRTHYSRIKSFVEKILHLPNVDKTFVELLFEFGSLVEKEQMKFKHRGGSFTMRATQMFLSTVLTDTLDKNNFVYELKSKFVNPLWGTNFENTDFIDESLSKNPYDELINRLFTRYKDIFIVTKTKPTKSIDDFISDAASIHASTSTSSGTFTTLDEEADALSQDINDAFKM